jgi:hypothetical protein
MRRLYDKLNDPDRAYIPDQDIVFQRRFSPGFGGTIVRFRIHRRIGMQEMQYALMPMMAPIYCCSISEHKQIPSAQKMSEIRQLRATV